jgi:hypothetical protein
MLDFVDVALGCEFGYDEVPLQGRHITELQFFGEQLYIEAAQSELSLVYAVIMCRK